MTPFEEELKKALSRSEPAEGLSERVLRQIAPEVTPKPVRHRPFLFPLSYWRLASLTALFLLLVSSLLYRQHVERVKGETAKKQLLVALHIAGSELRQAKLHVKRIEFQEVVMQ